MVSDSENKGDAAVFIAELRALCRKHGIMIATPGYEGLEILTLDGRNEIGFASIVDLRGDVPIDID